MPKTVRQLLDEEMTLRRSGRDDPHTQGRIKLLVRQRLALHDRFFGVNDDDTPDGEADKLRRLGYERGSGGTFRRPA